jgi:hypothetical protein
MLSLHIYMICRRQIYLKPNVVLSSPKSHNSENGQLNVSERRCEITYAIIHHSFRVHPVDQKSGNGANLKDNRRRHLHNNRAEELVDPHKGMGKERKDTPNPWAL